MDTPTLIDSEPRILVPGVPYVIAERPNQPFTVVGDTYLLYTAYVSRRGHFMVQRIDPAKLIVRC